MASNESFPPERAASRREVGSLESTDGPHPSNGGEVHANLRDLISRLASAARGSWSRRLALLGTDIERDWMRRRAAGRMHGLRRLDPGDFARTSRRRAVLSFCRRPCASTTDGTGTRGAPCFRIEPTLGIPMMPGLRVALSRWDNCGGRTADTAKKIIENAYSNGCHPPRSAPRSASGDAGPRHRCLEDCRAIRAGVVPRGPRPPGADGAGVRRVSHACDTKHKQARTGSTRRARRLRRIPSPPGRRRGPRWRGQRPVPSRRAGRAAPRPRTRTASGPIRARWRGPRSRRSLRARTGRRS